MKKTKTRAFDLMDTLVWSPNLMSLFASENAELLAKFKEDPRQYQRETARVAEGYLADGRVELRAYEDVEENLDRLRQDGKVVVLSNGVKSSISRILDRTGIQRFVDEAYSLEQFEGLDKSDQSLYQRFTHALTESGLSVVSYVDDKQSYCLAAAKSDAIPKVYQIDREGKSGERGECKLIRSLDEIE